MRGLVRDDAVDYTVDPCDHPSLCEQICVRIVTQSFLNDSKLTQEFLSEAMFLR